MNPKKKFICINCGHPVAELYIKYSETVSKIANCVRPLLFRKEGKKSVMKLLFAIPKCVPAKIQMISKSNSILQDNCHQVADKYIEFEPLVIIIDLILLSRPTYRHVLYNINFKVSLILHTAQSHQLTPIPFSFTQIYWKLILIILFLDAYISWSNRSYLFTVHNEDFTKEKLFYFCFGLSCVGSLIHLLDDSHSTVWSLINFVNFHHFRQFYLDHIACGEFKKMYGFPDPTESSNIAMQSHVFGKYIEILPPAHRHLEKSTK